MRADAQPSVGERVAATAATRPASRRRPPHGKNLMRISRIAAVTATVALLAPASALADGAESPQAVAANAQFLSATPAPAGGAGAVCVIDTGVDTDTDLGASLAGRDSVLGGPFGDLGALSDTSEPLPKHGTYVAGVISSQVDGVGASGIWPASKVLSNRVFNGGTATANSYIQAIQWCNNQPGVKVINLSLAGLQMTNIERSQLQSRIVQARDAYGMNVVAAAGNNGLSNLAYPAAYSEVFSVAATDASGQLASFSNRGAGLDIATFGDGVCVTTASGYQMGEGKGTSYAAPIVSAALNALRSYKPSLTPDQAEAALTNAARTVNGVKVLDVKQAFINEGLSSVVSAYGGGPAAPCEVVLSGGGAGGGGGGASASGSSKPPSASAPTQTVVVQQPEVAPPMISVVLPTDDPFAELMPHQPTLKRISFTKGRLRITVSGRRAGDLHRRPQALRAQRQHAHRQGQEVEDRDRPVAAQRHRDVPEADRHPRPRVLLTRTTR